MRNPARTLQNSIFEPLFSQEDKNAPPTKYSSSSDWPTPFSSPPSKKAFCNNMRRAPATIFHDHISDNENTNQANEREREREHESITCGHPIYGMHSSSICTSGAVPTTMHTRPSRSHSSSDVDNYDDGSIASKLLTSITKSISSPSLLSCCKESTLETPYQKTLRLRRMKLQHCAEELGSESSDGSSSCNGGENSIFDSLNTRSSFYSSAQFTTSEDHQNTEGNTCSMMISVRSSPNLRCDSLVSKHTIHTKEKLFPPPLTHTLRKSASSDSFSYSLCAYREDGRFVLKEVKVPCSPYLQANRKDGRLTLQLFNRDEEFESKQHEETFKGCQDLIDLQEDKSVENDDLYQAAVCVASDEEEEEVESANTANSVGEVEVCKLEEGKENDHVGMDKVDENTITIATLNVEKFRCLSSKSLLMAAFNSECGGKEVISQVRASSMRNSDFRAAKHKTGKVSRMNISDKHLSSGPWKQQTLVNPPGKSPRLRLSHDFDVTSVSQCEETNLVLQGSSTYRGISNIGGRKNSRQSFEIATSASLQKGSKSYGIVVGKTPSSTIIFKEAMSAECLMEEVTKLVNSYGLDGAKWCGEKMMKSRELCRSSSSDSGGVIKNSMYNGIKSINIGVREIDEGRSQYKANGVHLDVECGRDQELSFGAIFKDGGRINVGAGSLDNSSFHIDVQIPSSTYIQAALQGNGWQLHTLHCKELFDRNQLAKGFMKLHCVAIRS